MTVYQIFKTDFDHSWDANDVIPTDILFLQEENAKKYVEVHGGCYEAVELRDSVD